MKEYDAIVIGGGFFGLSVADYLHDHCQQARVLVLDKEPDFMQRASYNNQARVHGGYHYPRSLLTGLRSQANFDRFALDYKSAIVDDFDQYYAVAHQFSKVTARQFKLFCERIGAATSAAPKKVKQLFDAKLVDDVFKVREFAFDSVKMKKLLLKKLSGKGITLRPGSVVRRVVKDKNGVILETAAGQQFKARHVFNCTYSSINEVNKNSKLPLIDLKHELTEMCLIELPAELENTFVTVMCGPFFSYMPFPDKQLTTLSHVRYTPHTEWHDKPDNFRRSHEYFESLGKSSHFPHMIRDAARYLPSLANAKYVESLWEVKTVLPQSEQDDSRPILFRRNHDVPGYHCILGAKLDNIYDAFRELDVMYA